MALLEDGLGRRFSYVRLSVTEACNFRCQYCLPNGTAKGEGAGFLTVSEITRLARAVAELGVWKIRLTGGEPTVRRDFTEIIAALAAVEGITRLSATTNGYRLAREAALWRTAGLTHLNVSVDSLDPARFHAITGQDRLRDVLEGIAAARAAGFAALKVNAVLLRDVNDGETEAFLDWARREAIGVRFIELMRTGTNAAYFARHHLSADGLRARLLAEGWTLRPRRAGDGPAEIYAHGAAAGTVGIIAPYAKDFCAGCNRLRVTARGDLRLCLFGDSSHSLRDLLQEDGQKEELQARLCSLLPIKKPAHALAQGMTGLTPHLASLGG